MENVLVAVEDGFWAQPCEGLKGRYAPVSEDALCSKEKVLGVALPGLYRRLMKQQNGGNVRCSSCYDGERYFELFINGGRLSQLNDVLHFTSILDGFMSNEEIEEDKTSFEHCCLERLIVISELDGHGLVSLDYGWMQQHSMTLPAVVVFEQDDESPFGYVEVLRVADFERFVEALVYYGYESESFFVGVVSPMTLSELAGKFGQICGANFERHQDDRYGWFDFEEYYIGSTDRFSNSERFSSSSVLTGTDPEPTFFRTGRRSISLLKSSPGRTHMPSCMRIFPVRCNVWRLNWNRKRAVSPNNYCARTPLAPRVCGIDYAEHSCWRAFNYRGFTLAITIQRRVAACQ